MCLWPSVRRFPWVGASDTGNLPRTARHTGGRVQPFVGLLLTVNGKLLKLLSELAGWFLRELPKDASERVHVDLQLARAIGGARLKVYVPAEREATRLVLRPELATDLRSHPNGSTGVRRGHE